MRLYWAFFFLFLVVSNCMVPKLPWCSPRQSTQGYWIESTALVNMTEKHVKFERYYVGTSSRYALSFSQAWVPSSECSLHRFTKSSINTGLLALPTTDSNKRFTWLFIGDSALRGIFCGIIRILEGSEINGPCINTICGGVESNPGFDSGKQKHLQGAISYHLLNKPFEVVYFDGLLTLRFIYAKTLNTDPTLESVILSALENIKGGDALIHNSGAWDFYEYGHQRKTEGHTPPPSDNCGDDISRAIEQNRSSNATISAMLKISSAASRRGVKLIYRNNHYNERFGPLCADEKVEAALIGSRWEIFNNRDLSRDVWRQQCPDGFHFDRENIWTIEDHKKYAAAMVAKNGVLPGQLEMQLAQSLLFHILHDSLRAIH